MLAAAVYARAASGLVAGIEECADYRALGEQQKAALVKNVLVHYHGLEIEFVQLLSAAQNLTPSLVADLGVAARARSHRAPPDQGSA